MRCSSPSVVLPFGSLMGAVPIDALARGRMSGRYGRASDRDPFVAQIPATPVAGPEPSLCRVAAVFRMEDGGI